MKLSIIVMSMIFLVSCSSCKRAQQRLVCAQVKQAIVKPLPFYDVSFKFNRCRARCFDISNWQDAPANSCPELAGMNITKDAKGREVVDFPIEHCEGVAGPVAEDWAREVKPKMRHLIRMRGTYCE